MSVKKLCEQCGKKHIPEFVCDATIYQAWSDKCRRLESENKRLREALEAILLDMDVNQGQLNAAKRGFVGSRAMTLDRVTLFMKAQSALGQEG